MRAPFDGSLSCKHNNRIKAHGAGAPRLRLDCASPRGGGASVADAADSSPAGTRAARGRTRASSAASPPNGDYAEALRDPRARAAVVCTPHDRHLDDVLAALAAGRHVLVEKPLARTLEEADRMIDAARARVACS